MQLPGKGSFLKMLFLLFPLHLPAHSSMLTGTNPIYHGIRDNSDYRLDDFNVTLAEILKDKGFITGAVVSAFVLWIPVLELTRALIVITIGLKENLEPVVA